MIYKIRKKNIINVIIYAISLCKKNILLIISHINMVSKLNRWFTVDFITAIPPTNWIIKYHKYKFQLYNIQGSFILMFNKYCVMNV